LISARNKNGCITELGYYYKIQITIRGEKLTTKSALGYNSSTSDQKDDFFFLLYSNISELFEYGGTRYSILASRIGAFSLKNCKPPEAGCI
jgi:hypothetical protein